MPIDMILVDPQFDGAPRPAVIADDTRFKEVAKGEYVWGKFRILACGFGDARLGPGEDPCAGCDLQEMGHKIAEGGGILVDGVGRKDGVDGSIKRCWQKDEILEVRGEEAGKFVKSVFGVHVISAEFQLDSIPRCSFPNTSSQAAPREPKRRKVDVQRKPDPLPFVFETPEKRDLKLALWALRPSSATSSFGRMGSLFIMLLLG